MAHYSESPKCPKRCTTRCEADVNVDIDLKPRVKCESKRLYADFDVELDIDVNPRCKITPVETKHAKKYCGGKCVYRVELDFDCDAKVKCGTCPHTRGEVKLEVEVDHEIECGPKKCKVYTKSKDSSSKSKSHKEDCKKRRKHRHKKHRHEKSSSGSFFW